jgi:hypothetical protein
MISDTRLIFLGSPGYLPPPHRLSRCHGSRYNPNFAAVRDKSEKVKAQIRFNIPNPSQGGIQMFPYSTTSTTRQRPRVSSDSSTKVLESDAGLVGSSSAEMSESG